MMVCMYIMLSINRTKAAYTMRILTDSYLRHRYHERGEHNVKIMSLELHGALRSGCDVNTIHVSLCDLRGTWHIALVSRCAHSA